MYQALYRKWRPKTFDDVVGQAHVTKTLKSEVVSGRVSHAYLFTGSRGTGKTSCAKILAKAVNCITTLDGNPCQNCAICRLIEQDGTLDVIEIDAASNNGVENIRTMREEVVFSPTQCKYRVYIVDEVHMLSSGAFNAFLKVLEEPPRHVIFILATTEVHKLPVTIISRCQRFDFKRITSQDIFNRLQYVCNEENIKIESSALKLIANASDGGMRDALSILDQCANACENDITEAAAKQILGISGTEHIGTLVSATVKKDYQTCLDIIGSLHSESKNMLLLCEELMQHFRNFMIFRLTGKIEQPLSEEADFPDLEVKDILLALDILQEAYKNMNLGANKKLEMEITLVKLCGLNGGDGFKKIKDEKLDLEPAAKETASLPHLDAVSQVLTQKDNVCLAQWPQILDKLKSEKALKSLYISLRTSNAYESGNYVLIESENSLAFELLRNSEYRNALKKVIREVTGKQYNLGPYNKKSEEINQPDPLDELIKKAKDNKINITFN